MCGRCGASIWLILRQGFFDNVNLRLFQNLEILWKVRRTTLTLNGEVLP